MSKKLLGIVLCGGQSSRMGQQKSLLQHPSGDTYLQHAIHRMKDICVDVCIAGPTQEAAEPNTTEPNATKTKATDTEAELPTSNQPTLADPVPFLGPVVGIVSGLRFAKESRLPACLVTPVDMPNLTTDDLRKLLYAWRSSQQLTIAKRDTDQSLQPLVGVYPTSELSALRKLAEGEDRSLFRWIQRRPHHAIELSSRSCHNVNSPEDVQ